MHNSEFEKSVQEKMDELRLAPAAGVWEKVEATLPAKKKPRRFLFFLLVLLLPAAVLMWNKIYTGHDAAKKSTENSIAATKQTGTGVQDGINNNNGAVTANGSWPGEKNKPATGITENITATNPANSKAGTSRREKKGSNAVGGSGNDIVAKSSQKRINKRAVFKMQVKQPGIAEAGNADDTEDATPRSNEQLLTAGKRGDADSSTVLLHLKQDTLAIQDTSNKKPVVKSKWTAGIEGNAGFSSLMHKTAVVTAVNGNITGAPGAPQQTASNQPAKSSAAFAWGAGVYVKREINKYFSFFTGVRYQLYSSKMNVGKKVDSSIRVGFSTAANLTATSYYIEGSSSVYKNKLHLVELPVLLQYKPWASSFYIEGGPVVSLQLHSNALVYSNSVYITNNSAYNKLLFSVNAGAGVKLAQKTKAVFETGIRFSYGISTAVKPAYGKQHPLAGIFYLRLPLKK